MEKHFHIFTQEAKQKKKKKSVEFFSWMDSIFEAFETL